MASSTTSSTSTCSTMPARFPVGAIVVWEWLGDNGNWQPYLPKVVDYIEEKSRALKKIKLNAIAKKLRVYSIDLSSMIQIRENTGEDLLDIYLSIWLYIYLLIYVYDI